jgi:hypothetical protein
MREEGFVAHDQENFCRTIFALLVFSFAGCFALITTREQGGLIGAGLGAGTGALIGDQLMSQAQRQQTSLPRVSKINGRSNACAAKTSA